MRWAKIRIFLVFLTLCLLVAFLDQRNVLSPVRSVFQFGLSPIVRATYVLKNNFQDALSFITFWKSGEARIKNLEQKNLELIGKALRVEQLEKENRDLYKQLGTPFPSGHIRLGANVLGVNRFLIVGRGSKDGVRLGQSVVYLDHFIGKVIRVDEGVSFIQLPTDGEIKIPVKVGATGSAKGVTVGQFHSTIILDQVAQNEEIKVGDYILTSGEDGKILPDLILGRVKKIVSVPTDIFKKAEIEPLMTYDQLDLVFIIIR